MAERRTPIEIMIDRACGLEQYPPPAPPVVVPDTMAEAVLVVVDAAMAWWHAGGCHSAGEENAALARAVGTLHLLGWEA